MERQRLVAEAESLQNAAANLRQQAARKSTTRTRRSTQPTEGPEVPQVPEEIRQAESSHSEGSDDEVEVVENIVPIVSPSPTCSPALRAASQPPPSGQLTPLQEAGDRPRTPPKCGGNQARTPLKRKRRPGEPCPSMAPQFYGEAIQRDQEIFRQGFRAHQAMQKAAAQATASRLGSRTGPQRPRPPLRGIGSQPAVRRRATTCMQQYPSRREQHQPHGGQQLQHQQQQAPQQPSGSAMGSPLKQAPQPSRRRRRLRMTVKRGRIGLASPKNHLLTMNGACGEAKGQDNQYRSSRRRTRTSTTSTTLSPQCTGQGLGSIQRPHRRPLGGKQTPHIFFGSATTPCEVTN